MKKIICLLAMLLLVTGCTVGASTDIRSSEELDTINNAVAKTLELKDIDYQLIILRYGSLEADKDPFDEFETAGQKFDFMVKNWRSTSPEISGTYHDKLFEHSHGETIFMDKDRVYLISSYSMRRTSDIKAWFENTPENLVRFSKEEFGRIIEYITMYLKELPEGAEIKEVESKTGETEYQFSLTEEQFTEVFKEYVESVKHKYINIFGFSTEAETVRSGMECQGTIKVNSEGYVTEYTMCFKNEEHNPDSDEPIKFKTYTISLKFEEPGKDVEIEKPDFSEYQPYITYLNNLPEPEVFWDGKLY